jgi:hypothetical protein
VARGLSVRLGYAYSELTNYGVPPAKSRDHGVSAGLDFDRGMSLSLARQTTVSFQLGSTAVSDGERTRLHVTGRAVLNHGIGRSWNASLAYLRGVDARGGVQAVVFSDSASAGVAGVIGRRVQVRSAVGTAIGHVGVRTPNGFRAYYATSGAAYGLSRHAALDLTYVYYRSTYQSPAHLAPGVPVQFDRQSVRASLTLWAPLVYHARR